MTEQKDDTPELHDLLQRRLAQSAEAIADEGFTRAVRSHIRRRRRIRLLALGAGWVVATAACAVLLADIQPLVSGWRSLAPMVASNPMNWGPLLALLLVGVLSLAVTQGNVIDAS